MANDDGQHPRFDIQRLKRRQQCQTGDNARQRDRQQQQQRNAVFAEEVTPVESRCRQRAQHQRHDGGQRGNLRGQQHRIDNVLAPGGNAEPMQRKPLRREAESRILGVEGVDGDNRQREMQENQSAPGGQF
ncbi:hypothetical protein D3C80_1109060 [compost metagenome]